LKFLIDRCAGRRLAEWLRGRGHDVLEGQDLGPDPGDRVLLDRAAAEDRILVTMDKDFGKFLFAQGVRHCGLVRLPDVPADQRIRLMEQITTRFEFELSDHAVITVRGERIRISRSHFSSS
jgi:predicted nuclease of predicted toxin-antitoxin system